MSIEGQPNTILTVYSPFAWIQEITATNTGNRFNDLFANTIEKNTTSSLTIGSTNAAINIGSGILRTTQVNIGSNSGAVTSTGNVNIMTGNKQSGNFNLLNSPDPVNTGVITLGNIYGKIRLLSFLDRSITLAVNNQATSSTSLTGGLFNFTTTVPTVNVNGNNQYCFVQTVPPFSTGRYWVTLTVTFECSTTFSPYLEFSIYRRAAAIIANTSVVPGTDTQQMYFTCIQRFYTSILTDKMSMSMTGLIDYNPLLNSTSSTIGVAVKFLENVSGTNTLLNATTLFHSIRIA